MLADRIAEIQSALAEGGFDGWLFAAFQQNDPVSLDLLGLSGEGKLVTRREEVESAVAAARAAPGTVVIDFRVEQEDTVYPMVPTGNDLHDMIRRPSPIVETADD